MAIKRYFPVLALIIFSAFILRADLMDVYKKGAVSLVPDPVFGKNTDWEDLIYTRGRYITAAPDGCIFVANARDCSIYKFSPAGNLLKTFGQRGQGPGDVTGPSALSVLDDKYLIVKEDLRYRRVSIFYLDGNFVKIIKTGWPVHHCTALRQNTIALLTNSTEIKGNNEQISFSRIFIINIETGVQLLVLKRQRDLVQTQMNPNGYKTHYFERVFLLRTTGGNMLAGFNNNPGLTVYSPEGKKISGFNLKLERQEITPELRDRHYNAMVKNAWKNPYMPKKYRSSHAKSLIRDKRKILSEYPGYYPYYENLLIDSDNNILVLKNRYVDDAEWTPIYQVYSMDGRLKGEFGLDFGNYDTKPGIPTVFSGGNLYGIFEKETGDDIVFELVKMQLH
jgi:hypothetical protein